jgi:hypothetical protein
MFYRIWEKFRTVNKGTAIGLAIFGLVVVVGLGIPFWLMGVTTAAQTKSSSNCQKQNGATKTLTGTLRRAGSSFYIQEKSWHYIGPVCSGKAGSNCPMTEHAQMLDRLVGEAISAGYCENEVVSYTVRGVTYFK